MNSLDSGWDAEKPPPGNEDGPEVGLPRAAVLLQIVSALKLDYSQRAAVARYLTEAAVTLCRERTSSSPLLPQSCCKFSVLDTVKYRHIGRQGHVL